jgi:hypothetical protein
MHPIGALGPSVWRWRQREVTKLYLDEGPEWEATWDQVCAVLKRTSDTPIDRCHALAVVLQGARAPRKTH